MSVGGLLLHWIYVQTNKQGGVCLRCLRTCACGFDIIVKNSFILCSSRHAQQAGLRCCSVPNDEKTLQGGVTKKVTHFTYFKCSRNTLLLNIHSGKLRQCFCNKGGWNLS